MSCWCSYGDYVVVLIWDGQKGLTNESLSSLLWTNNCGNSKTTLKVMVVKICANVLNGMENRIVSEALEIYQELFR